MNNSNKKIRHTGVIVAILAMFYGGQASGQRPLTIDEVRKKIIPSHEIWLKYEALKYEVTPEAKSKNRQSPDNEPVLFENRPVLRELWLIGQQHIPPLK